MCVMHVDALATGVLSRNQDAMLAKLVRADLHGCMLFVMHSACKSMLGIGGIVLYESRNMFHVMAPSGVCKSIPKRGVVVRIPYRNGISFVVFGNRFRYSPSERSSRKFKSQTRLQST